MTRSRQKVRPIRIEGAVAYVTLSNGLEAVIDAEDAHFVEGWNWSARVTKWGVYAARTSYASGKKADVKMHRVILSAQDGDIVDHKNGDRRDNRKTNLRIATAAQNAQNAARRNDNSSGFKGVSMHKTSGKWWAYINVAGKRKSLGYYVKPEDAHSAYSKASAELHGEFGRAA